MLKKANFGVDRLHRMVHCKPMKAMVLALIIPFLYIGCATPLDNACFQYTDQKTLCKSDFIGIPPDFPDDLFFKWLTQKPSHVTTIGPFPVVLWGPIDQGTLYISGALVFKVTDKGKQALAFIEAQRGGLIVVWLAKDATDLDKTLLGLLVNSFNSDTET